MPPRQKVAYGGKSYVSSAFDLAMIESRSYYNLPLNTDYMVKITPIYWLMKDGEMVSFKDTKELLKIFPERKGAIKKFIKKERLKLNNKEDVVKIIRFSGEDTK